MTDAGKTLTTSEYSKISGIAVSTIAQMLRQGRLRGEKRNGKWAIDASEGQKIQTTAGKTNKDADIIAEPTVDQTPSVKPSGSKVYDVDTFVRMTYLTERGVRQWLKSGRLSGTVDDRGNALVDADNLERPELRHLIRK
jgi:hypothetical protein